MMKLSLVLSSTCSDTGAVSRFLESQFRLPANKTKESIAKPSLLMAQLFWSIGVLASAVSLRKTKHNVDHLHVAVVEGLSYPLKGAQVVRSQYFEFHSCVAIVDPARKRIWIFNPWRIGDRPRILNRVKDVQPNLVQRLVAMYRKRYTVYYRGGNQYSSSDCRYKVLKFVMKMSEVQHYSQLNGWIHLPH
jgi:hypothetical protein